MTRISRFTEDEEDLLTVFFIGDIFGKSGRRAVHVHLEKVKKAYGVDVVIANGENAAGGIGITPKVAVELFGLGVDVITTGNHIWKYKDINDYIEKEPRLVRPNNYPPGAPGRGFVIFETDSKIRVAVLNLMGRVFMEALDCPFQSADSFLKRVQFRLDVDMIIVDMHCEASSEKMAMAHHLDGRVSAVLGTHTHIPTADERILPKGTAFQTDVGMTGCYDSIIGMKMESVMPKFLSFMPTRFDQAQGEGMLCGVVVKLKKSGGLCQEIIPIRLGHGLSPTGFNQITYY